MQRAGARRPHVPQRPGPLPAWTLRLALRASQRTPPVSDSRGANAGANCCTTRLENAHGTEFRELLYPWHPWFGLRVGAHEAIDKSDGIVFRCSLRRSDADRWLEVPAWMFDRSACARVRVAADAHVDLAALTALAALLQHGLSDRFASSNAPLSGATGLSRDQNRGEVHATPDEADAGATSRAAADRPLFAGEPQKTIGDMPAWSGLQTEIQAAL